MSDASVHIIFLNSVFLIAAHILTFYLCTMFTFIIVNLERLKISTST